MLLRPEELLTKEREEFNEKVEKWGVQIDQSFNLYNILYEIIDTSPLRSQIKPSIGYEKFGLIGLILTIDLNPDQNLAHPYIGELILAIQKELTKLGFREPIIEDYEEMHKRMIKFRHPDDAHIWQEKVGVTINLMIPSDSIACKIVEDGTQPKYKIECVPTGGAE